MASFRRRLTAMPRQDGEARRSPDEDAADRSLKAMVKPGGTLRSLDEAGHSL